MKFLPTITFIFIFAICVAGQELPGSFVYKTENVAGSTIIQMTLNDEVLNSNAAAGKSLQALGIVAEPKFDVYSLLYISAQEDFQFDAPKDKVITLKLDDSTLELNVVTRTERKRVEKLAYEVLLIKISKSDFEKLMNSAGVLFTYGGVKYQLDQNNLDSFKYTKNKITEITQTAQPTRSMPSSTSSRTYYRGPRGGCYYLSGSSKVYVDKSLCN